MSDEQPNKIVPLVSYVGGEKRVLGAASIGADGTIEMKLTPEASQWICGEYTAGDFSLGFYTKTLPQRRVEKIEEIRPMILPKTWDRDQMFEIPDKISPIINIPDDHIIPKTYFKSEGLPTDGER